MREFLVAHGWLVKLAGSIAVVLAFAWLARRGTPRQRGGWTHAGYPLTVELFMVAGAAFITAAIVYNGAALFANEWWVPPVILALAAGFYWVLYEAFVATVRWNDRELQVFRPPFRPKSIAFADVAALRHHAMIECVSIRAADGTRIWLPYGMRIGMPELFARLAHAQAGAEPDPTGSATAPPG